MNAALKKKLYIKTYGCQMNFYDSSRMEDLMLPMGYEVTESPEDADLVVLNTCHIREKAAEKMYSDLGRIRPHKDRKEADGGRMVLTVAGCVAQAEGDVITKRAPYVDVVVGPQTYQQLPDLVARSLRDAGHIVALDFAANDKFDTLPEETERRQTQAFLTIQEGCDKFCTFCVVPYTRGAEFSRPVAEIVKEARQLVANGAVEITLLGQNVNAYHGEGPDAKEWGLGRLICELAEIDGLDRIRYTTSHPRDMDQELIAAHGAVPQLMPFLHLPVQSGSDEILRRMNRKHTADDYLRIIDALRNARPDIAFSSDFIVGFPGESDADFEDTMRLVERVEFAQAYSFNYSVRPGTPAGNMEDQLSLETKTERLMRLQSLLSEQQRAFNASKVGEVMQVLIEREGRHPGQMTGRSEYMQLVHLDQCDLPIGALVPVRITQDLPHGLIGTHVIDTEGKTDHYAQQQAA